MWQKGTGKRGSYRQQALRIDGTAFCRAKHAGSLKGFVVIQEGKEIVSARTAEQAWAKALTRLCPCPYEVVTVVRRKKCRHDHARLTFECHFCHGTGYYKVVRLIARDPRTKKFITYKGK